MAAPDPPTDPELRPGSLSIVRRVGSGAEAGFETFIKITADGSVTAFNGHVDLGTGIRTALGQIVAEELDVSFARVVVVLGDTSRVPNQGPTIASETIQISAVPLRKAAETYTIVGQSMPRIDLAAKATGELVYVHDVRLPGMLHGRVVRPPYAGVDAGAFVGTSFIAVDETSVRDIPGLVAVVRIGDFVGVVAEREENAIKAAQRLKLSWKPVPTLPDLADIETALRANPSTPRTLIDKGDVDAALG